MPPTPGIPINTRGSGAEEREETVCAHEFIAIYSYIYFIHGTLHLSLLCYPCPLHFLPPHLRGCSPFVPSGRKGRRSASTTHSPLVDPAGVPSPTHSSYPRGEGGRLVPHTCSPHAGMVFSSSPSTTSFSP